MYSSDAGEQLLHGILRSTILGLLGGTVSIYTCHHHHHCYHHHHQQHHNRHHHHYPQIHHDTLAEVEFVHAVTAGGSVKFLPAV